MTQATDLSPYSLPILLYTPILSMCTNFPPSVSSPNAFLYFLHLFHLILSLPLLFCLPSCFWVRGKCNTLMYFCLSPRLQHSGMWLDMLTRHQAWGWTGRLAAWLLYNWTAALRLAELRQWCLYGSTERGNLFPKWLIYCVWNAALAASRQTVESSWIVQL